MTARRGPGPEQLALFAEAQPRSRRPRRTPTHWPRRYHGRKVHTLPDIANYQETH
jgi:hypothetical protein